jgi:hypothetical protein
MKRTNWYSLLGVSLVAWSFIVYFIQVRAFGRTADTFFYMLQDLAFVPIQVLLVTLIISGLLDKKEKRVRLEKLNMVMGTFFSEVGTKLLSYFSNSDPELHQVRGELIVSNEWSELKFGSMSKRIKNYEYGIDIQKMSLEELRSFLNAKKDFLLRLLENPNLLEHESFTELLRAVFHLMEELVNREDIRQLPDSDYRHLAGDIKRAYSLLVYQWLDYMKHLKDNYPYLFSLAMRTNPFDQNASPIVK